MGTDSAVLVRLVDANGRQIGWKDAATDHLRDRLDDVRAAVVEGAQAIVLGLPQVLPGEGWDPVEVSASFGVSLSGEGGVILSKAGGEATFEITVTYRRTP